MIRIALYGKGGIGKSTTTANLAAALAEKGYTVMQIGCDPKSDSTMLLMHGMSIPTVLDQIRESGGNVGLEDIVFRSKIGVYCVEAGGPTPGIGCAGRGIITAFEKLGELHAYETYQPDVVLYDVLGDVVCGGFAMPLRGTYSDAVLVVTSGEKMSLYAARNIVSALDAFKARHYAYYGGIVLNRRNVKDETRLVDEFARQSGGQVIVDVPRSDDIQRAEEDDMTVVEAFPDAPVTQRYRDLAGWVMWEKKKLEANGSSICEHEL